MNFNPKIDTILDCVTREDKVGKLIVNSFASTLSSDTIEEIENGCNNYLDDFNYTYCDEDNDMFEVGYHTNPLSSDLTLAKHVAAYDEDNNYIGRNLSYLLRVITNNKGNNLCYVYSNVGNCNYNGTYKITVRYDSSYKCPPKELKRKI